MLAHILLLIGYIGRYMHMQHTLFSKFLMFTCCILFDIILHVMENKPIFEDPYIMLNNHVCYYLCSNMSDGELRHKFKDERPDLLIEADLIGISLKQYLFNEWFKPYLDNLLQYEEKPISLSKFKCWFWWMLPESYLGADPIKFRGWKIGHCLNCNASPYDCKVLSWSSKSMLHRGVLLKCSRCGEVRWQKDENGLDY